MEIKNFSIVEFVRYVLSGLNAIAFLLILPVTFLRPELLPVVINSWSVLSLILFGVAFRFLLDILKIYQLTPKYRVKQIEFFEELARALSVPFDQAPTYFFCCYSTVKEKRYLRSREKAFRVDSDCEYRHDFLRVYNNLGISFNSRVD